MKKPSKKKNTAKREPRIRRLEVNLVHSVGQYNLAKVPILLEKANNGFFAKVKYAFPKGMSAEAFGLTEKDALKQLVKQLKSNSRTANKTYKEVKKERYALNRQIDDLLKEYNALADEEEELEHIRHFTDVLAQAVEHL